MVIEALNDKAWTPAYVLADCLERSAQIDNIVVMIRYKDGTLDSNISRQNIADIALHSANLSRRVTELLQDMREARIG